MKDSFDHFYRENVDRIFRYVFFRVGRNREVAEDLASEIFLKAHGAFNSYDPTVSRSAWIYRIAHNHLANYYRDRKETVDLEDVAPVLVGEHGMDTLMRQESARLLVECLSRLSDEERELVTMKYLYGYAYDEMAEILGKNAGALKVATHRAMKKLKQLCSGLHDN